MVADEQNLMAIFERCELVARTKFGDGWNLAYRNTIRRFLWARFSEATITRLRKDISAEEKAVLMHGHRRYVAACYHHLAIRGPAYPPEYYQDMVRRGLTIPQGRRYVLSVCRRTIHSLICAVHALVCTLLAFVFNTGFEYVL